MPLEFQFICPLPNGVHARPASALEEVTSCFRADITLTNTRTQRTANAKSVLAIVGADIRLNDACQLTLSGPDEQDALAALSNFLRDEFPHCDEAIPSAPSPNGTSPLPPALKDADATIRHGTPVVRGIGLGRVVRPGGLRIPASIPTCGPVDFPAEVRKLDAALAALVAHYEEKLPRHTSQVETDLLKAHRAVARDPEFRARLHEALRAKDRTAAGAIADAETHFTGMLTASDSLLLRERALDIQDVCFQLLQLIYGKGSVPSDILLNEPAVVVAEMLTPGQFLGLDRRWLQGLVLGHAGTTSHTVILARSFGIPTLTGVSNLPAAQLQGQEAVVDAECGLLVTNLTPKTRRYYAMEQKRLAERHERERHFTAQPALTADGQRVEMAANISTAAEATPALDAGAEGIGLFRTEMLFLDRDEPPGEAEQFEQYRAALVAAGGRPVVIRTLDIGGDKPLPYLNLPVEENPFLGYRAVRIYEQFEPLFRTQVRALVRASAHGPLKIILPLVSNLDEVLWAKRIVREEQARCAQEGVPHDPAMPLGAMIEVPAAVFLLGELGRELDFFSIGTNDLLQYFTGVDRLNRRLARLYEPLQPAFLRFLKKIVDAIHAAGRQVSLCGEMGAQPHCLPVLVGLGLREISAGPSALAALKAELQRWPLATCRELAQTALACATAAEVNQVIATFAARRVESLVAPEMILVESESQTKEEAIKEAVDRLYVLGRTDEPLAVETAVWQREALYSTGFGHGFAIPHCKTNAVTTNSVAVLKLRHPVAWGSLDEQPVRVILLLAIRDSDQANLHMRILSRLARQVMHEDFRDHLSREKSPDALCAFLKETLSA